MSGAGSPTIQSDGTGLKVTIVAGQWHEEITNGLLEGARQALAAARSATTTDASANHRKRAGRSPEPLSPTTFPRCPRLSPAGSARSLVSGIGGGALRLARVPGRALVGGAEAVGVLTTPPHAR